MADSTRISELLQILDYNLAHPPSGPDHEPTSGEIMALLDQLAQDRHERLVAQDRAEALTTSQREAVFRARPDRGLLSRMGVRGVRGLFGNDAQGSSPAPAAPAPPSPYVPLPGSAGQGLPAGIAVRKRLLRCGKADCKSCPHGPYTYVIIRRDGQRRDVSLGSSPSARTIYRKLAGHLAGEEVRQIVEFVKGGDGDVETDAV